MDNPRITGYFRGSRWAARDARISPTCNLVYDALCSFANTKGNCWPAIKTIAADLGMARQMVQRHISTLAYFGYVEIEHQSGARGGKGVSLYHIPLGPDRPHGFVPKVRGKRPPKGGRPRRANGVAGGDDETPEFHRDGPTMKLQTADDETPGGATMKLPDAATMKLPSFMSLNITQKEHHSENITHEQVGAGSVAPPAGATAPARDGVAVAPARTAHPAPEASGATTPAVPAPAPTATAAPEASNGAAAGNAPASAPTPSAAEIEEARRVLGLVSRTLGPEADPVGTVIRARCASDVAVAAWEWAADCDARLLAGGNRDDAARARSVAAALAAHLDAGLRFMPAASDDRAPAGAPNRETPMHGDDADAAAETEAQLATLASPDRERAASLLAAIEAEGRSAGMTPGAARTEALLRLVIITDAPDMRGAP
jgi:hypothetical protein